LPVLIVHTHSDGKAELAWVAGYIPRWFVHPKRVTIAVLTAPDVILLMETNELLVS